MTRPGCGLHGSSSEGYATASDLGKPGLPLKASRMASTIRSFARVGRFFACELCTLSALPGSQTARWSSVRRTSAVSIQVLPSEDHARGHFLGKNATWCLRFCKEQNRNRCSAVFRLLFTGAMRDSYPGTQQRALEGSGANVARKTSRKTVEASVGSAVEIWGSPHSERWEEAVIHALDPRIAGAVRSLAP